MSPKVEQACVVCAGVDAYAVHQEQLRRLGSSDLPRLIREFDEAVREVVRRACGRAERGLSPHSERGGEFLIQVPNAALAHTLGRELHSGASEEAIRSKRSLPIRFRLGIAAGSAAPTLADCLKQAAGAGETLICPASWRALPADLADWYDPDQRQGDGGPTGRWAGHRCREHAAGTGVRRGPGRGSARRAARSASRAAVDATEWRRRYLDSLEATCPDLNVGVLVSHEARPGFPAPRVADVYVDLDAVECGLRGRRSLVSGFRNGEVAGPGAVVGTTERRVPGERRPVLGVIARHPRLVLTGLPGSGKSTILARLAASMLGAWRGSAEALEELGSNWDAGLLIPVRVDLGRFAAGLRGVREPRAADLWSFVAREARLTAAELRALKDEAGHGSLFLLDGWDEGPRRDDRLAAAAAILDLVRTAGPRTRFVLTARPYAIEEMQALADPVAERRGPAQRAGHELACQFRAIWQQVFTVEALSGKQSLELVQRWYRAIPRWGWLHRKQADAHRKAMETELRAEHLSELARSPLLLSLILALDSSGKSRLAEDRTELYEQAVDLLLRRWNEGSPRSGGLLDELKVGALRISDFRAPLEKVALRVHEGHRGVEEEPAIPRAKLQVALEPLLQHNSHKANRVIDYIERRAGLLIGIGRVEDEPHFKFVHRTFREFLAACALVAGRDLEGAAVKYAREDPRHWHEVLCFAARLVKSPARGAALAHAMVGRRPPAPNPGPGPTAEDEPRFRRALLAADQLREIGFAAVRGDDEARQVLEDVAAWLERLIACRALTRRDQSHARGLLRELNRFRASRNRARRAASGSSSANTRTW